MMHGSEINLFVVVARVGPATHMCSLDPYIIREICLKDNRFVSISLPLFYNYVFSHYILQNLMDLHVATSPSFALSQMRRITMRRKAMQLHEDPLNFVENSEKKHNYKTSARIWTETCYPSSIFPWWYNPVSTCELVDQCSPQQQTNRLRIHAPLHCKILFQSIKKRMNKPSYL